MKFIAVEHRSAESKGLRFESSWKTHNFFFAPRSWQDEKHLSLFFLLSSKLTTFLILFISELFGILFRFIIAYTKELRVLAVKHL